MMQNRLIQQKLFYNDDAPFKAAVTQSPVASSFHSCDIAQENYPGRYLSKVNWEKSDLDRLLHAPDHAALGESWSAPLPEQYEFHVHDHCQIVQNVSGRIAYIINGKAVVLSEKDILLINSNIPHTWMAEDKTVCTSIAYYPHMLLLNNYCTQFLPYLKVLYSHSFPSLYIPASDYYWQSMQSVLKDILDIYEKQDKGYDAFIHNRAVDLSLLFVQKLFREGRMEIFSNSGTTLLHAVDYIREHFTEDIGVHDVAVHIGLNSNYFSHYFKCRLGMSCKRYINIQRIEKSAALLVNSDQSILQIVYDCGFNSVSAFYNAFVSYYAMSPAKYRRLFINPKRL